MRTTWKPFSKKTKLTFLLSLTFLFLFSGFSIPFFDNFQDGKDAYDKKDYKTAHKIFLKLAKKGNGEAQSSLGGMYISGKGVPQDYKEAVKWYRISAEQGNVAAQNNLGGMYAQGKGVPEDDKEAVKWFRLSAEQGNALAQTTLGARFERGVGVPKDYVSAHMWYNLAASNGNILAEIVRYKLEKKMTPQQITQAQDMARNWKPKK